ncbi:MAG: VOC family protein [Thermomicrobiales bacterium]
MTVQLSMVGLMVKDMAASLAFYRQVGLDIPAGEEEKPFVLYRMESGVSLFWDTVFADTYDPARTLPREGYQSMLEFFLADDSAVDAKYAELTAAGYYGRLAPVQTTGPYAAMVDDPDGNVVLLTSG